MEAKQNILQKLGFKNIIILAMAAGILGLWFFRGPTEVDESKYIEIGGKKYKQLLERVETKIITVTKKGTAYTPTNSTVELERPVAIPQVVDTAAIIKEYYTKNYFEDRQAIDTLGFVTIKDTIFENSIFSRQLDWELDIPEKHITKIVEAPPVNKVYLGGGLNFDKVQILNSGYVGALFQTKKDKIIGVQFGGTNIDGALGTYIGGSLYWKLNFRKNK